MPLDEDLPVDSMAEQARMPIYSMRDAIRATWAGYRSAAGLGLRPSPGSAPQGGLVLGGPPDPDLLRIPGRFGSADRVVGSDDAGRRLSSGRPHTRPGSPLWHSPGFPWPMSRLHDDLISVLDAVEILSPRQFAIRDEVRDLDDFQANHWSRLWRRNSTAGSISGLRAQLARDHSTSWLVATSLLRLSAANNGRGTWEPGWSIRRFDDDGRAVVSKDDVTFWVPMAGLRTRNDPPSAGDPCRVLVSKEGPRKLVPGFYLAIGDSEGDGDEPGDDSEPLVRFYWALKADAAVPFLKEATATLNESGLPFRTKVLSHPGSYDRADAGVLYLR